MFIKKILLTLVILCFTVSCSTSKGGFGSGGRDELANNIPNYVLFPSDGAVLDAEARATLDAQVEWMKTNSDMYFIIEGHCDANWTREYNLALGAKRANAVKSYLIASGIDASRIATISYGKERPVVQGTGPEVWRQNRRAITVIN